ncbi:NADH-quinone oxidoreductase subunit C [Candidatus Poribacteria bacterium]|nr:NADH-quinone oxidoreductase subunit C [Candidatus Poribacteria bacterium]
MPEEQAPEAAPAEDPRPLPVRKVVERFGDPVLATDEHRGEWTVVVTSEAIHPVLRFLKTDPAFQYIRLVDLTAVDCLGLESISARFGGARFLLVYHLMSHMPDSPLPRLRVKCPLTDAEPSAPSATGLWSAADWLEREVYDMFGIVFDGHPDLRRILMPDDFGAFPLRKDYPVQGVGERASFDFERSGQTHRDE